MEANLIAKKDVYLEVRNDVLLVKKGEIIRAKFSQFGVRLLFGNYWTPDYSYENVNEGFEVYNNLH